MLELNLSSIKPFKYNTLEELLCGYFNCNLSDLEDVTLIEKEIETQLKITFQEFRHEILIQKNWGFLDDENTFHYWKSSECPMGDFLALVMRQLLEVNKENFDAFDEDIRNEQITLLARESYHLMCVC